MADWNIFQPTDASKPIHQILSGIQRGGFYVTNDNDEDRSRQALLDALAAAGYPAPSPSDPVYVHRTDTGNLERNTGSQWEIVDQWRPGRAFAEASGYQFISMSGGRGGGTITFPPGRFTQAPIITVSATSSVGRADANVSIVSRTASGFEVGLSLVDGTAASGRGVYWTAKQMTPTSADG